MSSTPCARQDAAHTRRYEQLREHVIDGPLRSDRLGLAVVVQEGLAAWLQRWSNLPLPLPLPKALGAQAPAAAIALPEAAGAHVVQVLSAMALGHLQEASA